MAILAALLFVVSLGLIVAARPQAMSSPAADLALRLDGLLDQVEEPKAEITPATIGAWTVEILPFFEYEGLTASAVMPDDVQLTLYPSAMENFHVLGRAACGPYGGGPVEINARVANPVSAWYGRPSFLATLVHELGHIQGGGFCQGSSAELESTTQLAALEVLAAMANGGNRLALYAVLDELRYMALAAAKFESLESGDLDGYAALEKRIYSTAIERARAEKSKRRWRSDPATLREILHKYSKIPVDKILSGLRRETIPNLKLAAIPEFSGFINPENPRRDLVIDDLAYVIEHADELLGGRKS